MTIPLDIAHVRAANLLRVTWNGDQISDLPVPYLRSWCPCAECQGHSGVVRQRPVNNEITLLDAWEIGSYAIGLRFSDRHDKGLYTWRWLSQLAYESAPEGAKTGECLHGVFGPASQ